MASGWAWALLAVTALLGLGAVSGWLLAFRSLRRQGELLLELDAMRERLGGEPGAEPEGLSVGTGFGPFQLPDLNGEHVALEDFRGRRLMLVHWSPECGFCDVIAPDLADLQAPLRWRGTELVLVSFGAAEASRQHAAEHALTCRILLQDPDTMLLEFETFGTPVAYLLDEKGCVSEPMALGSDAVLDLARRTAEARRRLSSERPLSESRLIRDGLPAGTPAPDFELPNLNGGTVSLSSYRGRRVLLVFSDPDCGPCEELLPKLVPLHRRDSDGLAIVMVTRGDPEENRRKLERHAVEFPVALQPRWRLSKEYGIFATPVAYLIDPEGAIEQPVAQGEGEILRLLRHAGGARRRFLIGAA